MEEQVTPELIDIGERHLAMRARGHGLPTVVIEVGMGGTGSEFDAIARQIATFTQVVWYDRAGLGKSDPAPRPRSILDIVSDLHRLLHITGITGPLIFAGHSLGGLVARLYRECYPKDVAGLVLIDSSHEDQQARDLALLPPQQPDELPDLTSLRHSLLAETDPNRNIEKIDKPAGNILLRNSHSLGDLPLTVISRGRAVQDPTKYPSGLGEAMDQSWRQMQCDLARLSSRSRHIIATNSGHMINEDEPEVIIKEIRQMVMLVREQLEL